MADCAAFGRSQSAGPSRGILKFQAPTSGAETSLSGPGDRSRSLKDSKGEITPKSKAVIYNKKSRLIV
jgi:hypothetical protein